MKQTICKPSDISFDKNSIFDILKKCSRCHREIEGDYIEIKANFTLTDMRMKRKYRYCEKCIESNQLIIKLNYWKFLLLYKWERLHYKLTFLNFIGLGFHQIRRRVKHTRNEAKEKQRS